MAIDLTIVIIAFLMMLAMTPTGATLSAGSRAALGAIMVACFMGVRFAFRMYGRIWRYANTFEYIRLLASDCIAGGAFCLAARFLIAEQIGLAQLVAAVCLTQLITLLSRLGYQALHYKRRELARGDRSNKINVAIIGAGQMGVFLADELRRNKHTQYAPHCFFDDDPRKIGSTINGLRVYSANEAGLIAAMPVQEIIIAIHNLADAQRRSLYERFEKTGCRVKIYDFPLEMQGMSHAKRMVRDIAIEDLLFRKPVDLNCAQLDGFYAGKRVLITGAGGSIGSELCRQIARLDAKTMILLDIYENNVYDLQQELSRKYAGAIELRIEIASVRDARKIEQIMAQYRPQIVFHAAAHKHVHLMEHCSDEAIKNNVFGTHNVVEAAEKYGVDKFIMISTDKAVNPTNIMGASKRLCEMIVESKRQSATSFSAVRFGNVLGSNGSVVPLFRRQIEAGGPITITDKRIIRYFMTIPEAASLVLQAGAMAKRSEIYVLDMGNPLKILDLAERMIRLSGYMPYEEIDIVEIGLRPGEKLYEELLIKTEELDTTENEQIFIERGSTISPLEILHALDELQRALDSEDNMVIRQTMKKLVPTFHEADGQETGERAVV